MARRRPDRRKQSLHTTADSQRLKRSEFHIPISSGIKFPPSLIIENLFSNCRKGLRRAKLRTGLTQYYEIRLRTERAGDFEFDIQGKIAEIQRSHVNWLVSCDSLDDS